MALFALVSAMTFQGLHISMTVQGASEERARDFGELHLVWTLMMHDFVHLARRPVRNQYGTRMHRAFMSQGDGCAVSFTRHTPFSKSGLQRVAYCHIDEGLYRRVWTTIDRGGAPEYREALLISEVEGFSLDTEGMTSVKDNSPQHIYEQLPTHIEVSLRVGDEDYVRYFPGLSAYDPFDDQNAKPRSRSRSSETDSETEQQNKNDDNRTRGRENRTRGRESLDKNDEDEGDLDA